MCNIAKGIANLYPTPYQEWYYTQIKRQPAVPLKNPQDPFITLEALSTDYFPLTLNNQSIGIQYSYYYIFDNNEESRLGPWTNPSWTIQLALIVLSAEYQNYLQVNATIIKAIQFVYRFGNDGVVYAVKRLLTSQLTQGTGGTPDAFGPGISNAYLQPRAVISSDITNARFDSVPLLSATNEIAQNRLNHGNYLIDYPPPTGIALSVTPAVITRTDPAAWRTETAANFETFRPSGIYGFAVELTDEWGRTTTLVAPREVQIPASKVNVVGILPTQPALTYAIYNEDFYRNSYTVAFSITGALPSWAKYVRLMMTKDQSVNYFHKTIVRLFYWYVNNLGEDIFVIDTRLPLSGPTYTGPPDSVASELGEKLVFTRRGYAAEVISPMPFIFTKDEDQYIRIAREYWFASQTPANTTADSVEYKLTKQAGNMFMFETSYKDLSPTSYNGGNTAGDPITGYDALFYTAEFGSKKTVNSGVYYQCSNIITRAQYIANGNQFTGSEKGDCYISAFKKDFIPVQSQFGKVATATNAIPNIRIRKYNQKSFNIIGCFTSMNPRNIYLQSWNSDIGQENIINEDQRQTRRPNDFLFSDPLIQGTQINGLSKFNSIDNRQTPLENGPITGLFTTNARQGSPGVMLAIGKVGVSSFYIGATQLTNVDGSSNVASTTDYAVSQNPLLGLYGAGKLRNICKTPLGTLYWWSEIVNDWIRYSQAGLDRLGQNNSFGNDLRISLAGNQSIFTTYDQVTDEAILVGRATEAFVFSEQYKTLQPKRSYLNNDGTPERGLSLSQKTIFFLNGQIWVMGPNVNVPDNSFFGSSKVAILKLITNVEPTVLKRWNSYNIFGPKPIVTEIATENALESSLPIGWWIPRKDSYQAAIKCASNSTGGLLDGKVMESRILITNFVFDPSNFDKINYIEVKATRSPTQ
jgi:hypothetical protein